MKLTYLSTRETSARVLEYKDKLILFSYETPVAVVALTGPYKSKLFLDEKFYSVTTSRHISLFKKKHTTFVSEAKLPSEEIMKMCN